MNRRNFLLLSSLSIALSQVSLAKTIPNNSLLVLQEVYEHLFPKTSTMPSATEFGVISYLQRNMYHETFDNKDAHLIVQGSIDFQSSFPNFLSAAKIEKEQMIQTAAQSQYGYDWLSKLLHYGIEAMLSDPIYGGNTNEVAWKALHHKAGLPRPKVTYARRVL